MYKKLMNAPCLDRYLSIICRDLFLNPVNLNAHQSRLDSEILRLKLMKMKQGPFWSIGAIYEFSKVIWYRTFDVMFVGLAKQKTAPRRRFEEFGSEQSSKTIVNEAQLQ